MVEDLPVSEVEVAQHESDVHLEFVAPRTGQKRKGGKCVEFQYMQDYYTRSNIRMFTSTTAVL